MRILVQRVSRAEVRAGGRVVGSIGRGLLVLVGLTHSDGDAVKGRRPSFVEAARPETAMPHYERFVASLRGRGLNVATGEFGADMAVEVVNDGPVTLWLER